MGGGSNPAIEIFTGGGHKKVPTSLITKVMFFNSVV
jgi:hypothetical protein